jgi:hypothetical protein
MSIRTKCDVCGFEYWGNIPREPVYGPSHSPDCPECRKKYEKHEKEEASKKSEEFVKMIKELHISNEEI